MRRDPTDLAPRCGRQLRLTTLHQDFRDEPLRLGDALHLDRHRLHTLRKEPQLLELRAADTPAIQLFHEGEYSATGYFGNEGGDTGFYVYAALHVTIPPFGEGPRQAKG